MIAVLDDVGWVQDVVVNERTGMLIDGHLRTELAVERGERTIPIVYVDLSPEEEATVLATLDPLAAMATVNTERLESLLRELTPSDDAIRGLLDNLASSADIELHPPPEGLTDPDDVPDVPDEPYVQRGEIYALGEHKIMCGDATAEADVAALLAGASAYMIFTDPPYGVSYQGGSRPRESLEGDESCETAMAGLRAAVAVLDAGGAVYCCSPPGSSSVAFGAAFVAAGLHFASTLIWAKDNSSFGRADYQWMHEPIIYGWREGAPHRWHGDRKQTTLWEIPRPARSDEHPTMKPVELVERGITNSSRLGDLILDPFLGSGTTMIAAERLGRRCYGMEISEQYTVVAIERWEAFTGQKAERI